MVKIMFSGGSRAWANNLNDLRERWKLRREEPTKNKVPAELFKKDIQNLSREDLLKLKLELIELLNKTKKEVQITSIYTDRDKHRDLRFAIMSIGTHIEAVNHALSKKPRPLAFPQIFMDVCEERLSPDFYEELIKEAKKRFGFSEE